VLRPDRYGPMEVEDLASDRSSWRSLCKDNMPEFESSCMGAKAYLIQNVGPGLGGFWCDTWSSLCLTDQPVLPSTNSSVMRDLSHWWLSPQIWWITPKMKEVLNIEQNGKTIWWNGITCWFGEEWNNIPSDMTQSCYNWIVVLVCELYVSWSDLCYCVYRLQQLTVHLLLRDMLHTPTSSLLSVRLLISRVNLVWQVTVNISCQL